MKIRSFIFVVLPVLIFSCSTYDKIYKSSDNELKYNKAMQYYEQEDYVRAGNLFDQIINVYRGTTRSDSEPGTRLKVIINKKII